VPKSPSDAGSRALRTSITPAALRALQRDPRRAISEDEIVCLVCGRIFRHLTNTHLAHHDLTSEGYKQRFGYNGRRSLMAHAVRRLHAGNAVRLGLAQLIRQRLIVVDPTLRSRGGTRARAFEELLSRRDRHPRPDPPPPRDAGGRFLPYRVSVAGGVA
jgi:hypothetical protein